MATAARVIGLVFGLIVMVGFGACGAFGLAVGVSFNPANTPDGWLNGITAHGAAGIVISVLAGWLVWRGFRRP